MKKKLLFYLILFNFLSKAMIENVASDFVPESNRHDPEWEIRVRNAYNEWMKAIQRVREAEQKLLRQPNSADLEDDYSKSLREVQEAQYRYRSIYNESFFG